MEGSILAQRERVSLGNGMALRLLSALEVLQARREAGELAGEDRERALCSNACLLARALEREEDESPVFSDGRAVLAGLTVEEIGSLAARWSVLRRESDPGPFSSSTVKVALGRASTTVPSISIISCFDIY